MCFILPFRPHLTHEIGKTETHDHRRYSASNESFPSLLRAQLNERSSTHEEAKHVSHHVIDDNHHDGKNEPDEPLEHVLDDEIRLGDHA